MRVKRRTRAGKSWLSYFAIDIHYVFVFHFTSKIIAFTWWRIALCKSEIVITKCTTPSMGMFIQYAFDKTKYYILWLSNVVWNHGPLTRYNKLRVAHAPGKSGTFSPPQNLKETLVSDLDMHHGTCVTHVSGYMPGSLNRGGGENVPVIPGACAIFRIWQEAHVERNCSSGPCFSVPIAFYEPNSVWN